MIECREPESLHLQAVLIMLSSWKQQILIQRRRLAFKWFVCVCVCFMRDLCLFRAWSPAQNTISLSEKGRAEKHRCGLQTPHRTHRTAQTPMSRLRGCVILAASEFGREAAPKSVKKKKPPRTLFDISEKARRTHAQDQSLTNFRRLCGARASSHQRLTKLSS